MAQDLKLQVILGAIDRVTAPLRKITRASEELSAAMAARKKQGRELDQQLKDVTAYRTANIEIRKQASAVRDLTTKLARQNSALTRSRAENDTNRAAARTARTAYNKLSSALIQGKASGAEFRTELEKARIRLAAADKDFTRTQQSVRRLKDQIRHAGVELKGKESKLQQTQQRLAGYKKKLDDAGISTDRLGAKSRGMRGEQEKLNATLEAQKKKLDALQKVQERKERFDARIKSIHRTGMVIGAHGAGAMLAGRQGLDFIGQQMQAGIEFDSTMSQVQALTRLDKNSAELKALREQARQLGADTMFSATDAAQGQSFLAMAGFTPQAIRDAMPGMLDLAKAGGTEIAETADIASNILQGFGLKAGEMGRVGDVLVGTFTRSNTNLAMLSETMKYAAPIAASLGQDIEVMAAMAGKLGDAGIQGSMGGTALRAILNRLSAPPKAAAKALDKLGISAADARGNLKPMPKLLREIYDRTKNMGETQRAGLLKGIAGEEAVSALSVLVNQAGNGELEAFINTLKEAQGEAARTAKVMGDNLTGELDELSSAWEDVRIGLFDQQEGGLRELVKDITDVVRSVGEWARENPELAAGITKFVGVMLAAITVIGGFGVAIGAAMMLVSPLMVAIGLLAVAGYLLWQNWDNFVGGFVELLKNVLLPAWIAVWDAFKFVINNLHPLAWVYKAIAGLLRYFGVELPDTFTGFGGMIMQGLIDGFTRMFPNVSAAIGRVADSVKSWFKEKLGIHSPSRVFAELGGYTMEGLEQGIVAGQRGPLSAVAGMGKQLAAAGAITLGASSGALAIDNRPPLAAAGGAQMMVQGDTINITIQAGAGADSAALAQQINRLLDERERSKAARMRSALYDRD